MFGSDNKKLWYSYIPDFLLVLVGIVIFKWMHPLHLKQKALFKSHNQDRNLGEKVNNGLK